VTEIREVLLLWVSGAGLRRAAECAGVDRKTARRYVQVAQESGLTRESGPDAVDEVLVGAVAGRLRPGRPSQRGASWADLEARHDRIQAWVDGSGVQRDAAGKVVGEAVRPLSATKITELLHREGCPVAYRTVHRYVSERCGFGRKRESVPVVDGEPGHEVQIDFGYMGLLADPVTGRRRKVHALVFTAVVSRMMFVYLTFSQTLTEVIAGCEQAWEYFGGVFRVAIPDNLTPVVKNADPVNPVFQVGWLDYSQHAGFVTDPARVRSPKDKPRVERMVQYVRGSMWDGEVFVDLDHARAHARAWCDQVAQRVHGSTRQVPAEHFAATEAPVLLDRPTPYDPPVFAEVKVHPDRHVQVCKALYSVPGHLTGRTLLARADSQIVKLYHRGQLIKTHPRQPPGGRSTDREDLPAHKTAYAMRDVDQLVAQAAALGPDIGTYAHRLLDTDLPWTRMRSVYRLISLTKRYGSEVVQAACATSLEIDVVSVSKIDAMCRRATENRKPDLPATGTTGGRFARETSEFRLTDGEHPFGGGVQLTLILGGKADRINPEMIP
jgi:transposase